MGKIPGNGHKGGGNLLRVFIGVEMPASVQEEIHRIQDELRRLDLFQGVYVKPELAHLTLQFIGYIEPIALVPIKNVLKAIDFSPVTVHLGRVGVFGNRNIIKVIWVNVVGNEIVRLAQQIEQSLSLGVAAPQRAFQSHVTLARVKEVTDVEAVYKAVETILVKPISFTVDEFVLKHSTLTAEGPVYVDLERYKAS